MSNFYAIGQMVIVVISRIFKKYLAICSHCFAPVQIMCGFFSTYSRLICMSHLHF